MCAKEKCDQHKIKLPNSSNCHQNNQSEFLILSHRAKYNFRKYEYAQEIALKVPIELLYLQGPYRKALSKSHLYLTKLNKRK